jgi:hypothetical protein
MPTRPAKLRGCCLLTRVWTPTAGTPRDLNEIAGTEAPQRAPAPALDRKVKGSNDQTAADPSLLRIVARTSRYLRGRFPERADPIRWVAGHKGNFEPAHLGPRYLTRLPDFVATLVMWAIGRRRRVRKAAVEMTRLCRYHRSAYSAHHSDCAGQLALAAALNPNFRVAPFSAVLVLLISGQLSEGPIESALYRVAEVALGGVIAVTVSLLVLPERAHHLGLEAAARALEQLARVLPVILAGFTRDLDPAVMTRIQDDIGKAVSALQAIMDEAKRERLVNIVAEPDPGPLSRTLLRLRHDLVIIGRAAVVPLPDILAQRLGPTLTRLGANVSNFLHGCATALTLRSDPPPIDGVEVALKTYTSEIASLRAEGLTHSLSISEVERLFALGFALEQLHQHFTDLERCVREAARSFAGKSQS